MQEKLSEFPFDGGGGGGAGVGYKCAPVFIRALFEFCTVVQSGRVMCLVLVNKAQEIVDFISAS